MGYARATGPRLVGAYITTLHPSLVKCNIGHMTTSKVRIKQHRCDRHGEPTSCVLVTNKNSVQTRAAFKNMHMQKGYREGGCIEAILTSAMGWECLRLRAFARLYLSPPGRVANTGFFLLPITSILHISTCSLLYA